MGDVTRTRAGAGVGLLLEVVDAVRLGKAAAAGMLGLAVRVSFDILAEVQVDSGGLAAGVVGLLLTTCSACTA